MPYFRHGYASLYYEESGKGAPLLFLHGASLDLRQWSAQMSHFSSQYRVIAMDARGHGKSSLPEGEVSPDVLWRDVIALMDHLEIQKPLSVAHPWAVMSPYKPPSMPPHGCGLSFSLAPFAAIAIISLSGSPFPSTAFL